MKHTILDWILSQKNISVEQMAEFNNVCRLDIRILSVNFLILITVNIKPYRYSLCQFCNILKSLKGFQKLKV
jgi:hypothetical protein